jgi:hypothetical protein
MTLLAATAVAAIVTFPAVAQDDRPERPDRQRQRDRMTPEQAQTVWTLQAGGVANGLGVSGETTKQLTEAYIAARRSANEAMRSRARGEGGGRGQGARGEGGGRGQGARGGRGGFGADLFKEQREELHTALSGFLTEKQVEKAMPTLGSFNRSWDSMVFAVSEMKLDDSTTFAALKPIEQYIAAVVNARESGDWQAMREVVMDARTKLEEQLGAVLDEDQMKQFTEAAMGRGGRGGRGGAGAAARFMQLDENGDGLIQKSELPEGEGLEELFDRLDRNADGVLDRDELRNARGGRGGRGGGNLPEIF